MPIQFGQFQNLDYGRVQSNIEGIKGQRLKNALLGQQVSSNEQKERIRQQRQQIRQMTDNAGEAAQQMEAAGDFEGARMIRETATERLNNTIKTINDVQGWVTDQDTYDQLRSNLLQAGAIEPDEMPVEFKRSFFANQVKKLRGDIKKLTFTQADEEGQPVAQDIITNALGERVEGRPYDPRQARATAKADGKGGAAGIKATDAGEIRRQAAQLYGGFYDPATGQFSGLDPDKASKVQALQEEAERIYAQGQLSHGRAVTAAARRLGIDITDASGLSDDPVRNFLQRTAPTPAGQ